ncbi:hypothetical protein MJO29_003815 [Puccinia striiformis f. sp. tritici]|nr:hypothetical protein MJO29_003815 [Puccinia striiformis f. sp. tritici]
MVLKNSPSNRTDSESTLSSTPSHHPSGSSYSPAEKLTRADDLMSDVLDCFLWPAHNNSSSPAKRTIKFTPDYRRPRALNINDFKKIIHSVQTGELRNLTEATTVIRQLPAVINYLHNAEPPRLGKHIGLYLQLFLPKCGVRFCETDRYDSSRQAPTDEQVHPDIQPPSSHCSSPATQSPSTSKRRRSKIRANELRDLLGSSQPSPRDSPGPSRRGSTRSGEPYSRAKNLTHLAVFAARDYVPNDIVMGCEGSFADLTEEEDLKLRSNAHLPAQADGSTGAVPRESTDFSHIVNSRGKFQVFCGPARFVNHDCENNAILLREGFTIKFKVTKSIKAGEEILTSYGMNYFGERNCECMCATCERTGKGFYNSQEEIDSDSGDNEQLIIEHQTTPIKYEFEDPNPTVPGLGTDTDLSSLLDSSEDTTSRASNTPALEQSPTISYSTTPSQVRRQLGLASQPQSALADHRSNSRSSSTRRGRPSQPDHQDRIRTNTAAFISPVKFLPTQDLTLPIFAPPETEQAQSTIPLKQLESPPTSQPVGKSTPVTAQAMPVKRKTYWITTKQKQLGLVPWGDDTDMPGPSTSQPYSPLTPSLLGPSRRDSSDRAPPRQKRKAATEPRPARLPIRSYWVSTKEKQLGILPWKDDASDGNSEPTANTPRPTRSTRASRRASEHMNAVVDFPTAPRGSKLSYKVFQEGSQEAEMLSTAIGRELLGFRPRVIKKKKVVAEEADNQTTSTDHHQLASSEPRVKNDQDGDALMVPFEEITSFLLKYPGDEPVGHNSQTENNATERVDQENRTGGERAVERPVGHQPSTVASTSGSPSTCTSSTSPKTHSRSRRRTTKDSHSRPSSRQKRKQQSSAASLPSSPSSSCLSSLSQADTSLSSALPPPINSISEPPLTLSIDTTPRLVAHNLRNDIQPKNDPASSSESSSATGHRLLVSSIG